MMTTPGKSEGPEVAASEPSEPAAPQKNEQENPIMTQRSHNPFPVDPTGPLTMGTIPDADLDRLIAATIAPIERLRSAVDDVDPAQLTARDVLALFDLIQAAYESESAFGKAIRQAEGNRKKAVAEVVQ